MTIRLLTVGKTDVAWVKEGLDLYSSRLRHYAPFSIEEIPQLKGVASLSKDEIKSREGALILKSLKEGETLILLDERGKKMRSKAFAEFVSEVLVRSRGGIVFAVGGAYGFSEDVYRRSSYMISLSDMTFSHQMVRVIFAEQLYRAFTIMKGEPYHNE